MENLPQCTTIDQMTSVSSIPSLSCYVKRYHHSWLDARHSRRAQQLLRWFHNLDDENELYREHEIARLSDHDLELLFKALTFEELAKPTYPGYFRFRVSRNGNVIK